MRVRKVELNAGYVFALPRSHRELTKRIKEI